MERQLLLAKPPYRKTKLFTRENTQYEAVRGRDTDGLGYCWVEKVELVRGIYKAKLMPTRNDFRYQEGKIKLMHTYWAWHYYNAVTNALEHIDKEEDLHDTVYADMIYFCQHLADPILDSMLNGVVIGPVMGYPTQPLVVAGVWVDDTEQGYDTSLPADKVAYTLKQPVYQDEPAL